MALVKKQGFEDTFFVIAVLFAMTIFILIVAKAWSGISPQLDTTLSNVMPDDSPVNVTVTLDQVESTTQAFNTLLPFLLIGLFGFILLGAAIYMQHPIMIFVGIIILAIAILLGAVYSNVYQDIAESDSFSDVSSDFGLFNTYMQYLPILILVMFIGIIIFVVWTRQGGGQQSL